MVKHGKTVGTLHCIKSFWNELQDIWTDCWPFNHWSRYLATGCHWLLRQLPNHKPLQWWWQWLVQCVQPPVSPRVAAADYGYDLGVQANTRSVCLMTLHHIWSNLPESKVIAELSSNHTGIMTSSPRNRPCENPNWWCDSCQLGGLHTEWWNRCDSWNHRPSGFGCPYDILWQNRMGSAKEFYKAKILFIILSPCQKRVVIWCNWH